MMRSLTWPAMSPPNIPPAITLCLSAKSRAWISTQASLCSTIVATIAACKLNRSCDSIRIHFMNKTRDAKTSTPCCQRCMVAVVQAAPIAFDLEQSLQKAQMLVAEAATRGAQLVLFPEAFVSAYPRGLDFGAVVGARSDRGREEFRRYWESSVDVPGPPVKRLGQIARKCRVYLVIGVVERDSGTLYCTILFFAPDGVFLGKHRKIMP